MNPAPKKSVWLVIPCFNDSERLGRYLPRLCEGVAALPLVIQVVDDGSREEEKRRLEDLVGAVRARHCFVRPPLFQGRNQGKGAAILRGWAAAEAAGESPAWFGFLDADGAVPGGEVRRLISRLAGEEDARLSLFASRVRMRGRKVQRSLARHLTGRIFASLVGLWIDPNVYDSQCGFNLIAAEAYRKVRPLLREPGFAFDVELLAALNHQGCPVEEAPIDWVDVPGSKVSLGRDSLRMFRSVRLIRSRMAAWPPYQL